MCSLNGKRMDLLLMLLVYSGKELLSAGWAFLRMKFLLVIYERDFLKGQP